MSNISRRAFLAGSTSLLTTAAWAQQALPSNPDVVVIGAGAAGISAARELIQRGREVLVLEAADRTGGRILTNTTIFGVPYDVGAHWMHNARKNPFVGHGSQHGFNLYADPVRERIYVGDKLASKSQRKAYKDASSRAYDAIDRAGSNGQDVSAKSVLPDLGEWEATVELMVGPYEMGKDLEDFSCSDWYSGEEGSDWFCKEGFGAVWAHASSDVPVQLNTKATEIHWAGNGVTVKTDRGDIRAKACIVTVSTGVLAAQGIKFVPQLPETKQEAFHGISMGSYNHIALQFRDNALGVEPDTYLTYQVSENARGGIGFLTNASGSNLTYSDVGGRFAKELEKATPEEAIDFALGELRGMFGSSINSSFIKGHVTAWGRDPLIQGAYASAKPGGRSYRSELRKPVGDRIWFAGEACSRSEWATVAGAHKNGKKVAKKLNRIVK